MFAEPSASDRLSPRDVLGHLLIIRPEEYLKNVQTKFSKTAEGSDCIKLDVVDLDEQGGTPYYGALWFQGKLIGAMKGAVGQILLGRVKLGLAQPGMNAPFEFESCTADTTAVARAQTWLHQHPEFTNSAMRQQQAPAQQQPQYQQPLQGADLQQQQQTVLQRLQQQAGYLQPQNLEQQRAGGFGNTPPF